MYLIFLGLIMLGCNSRYGYFYNHERLAYWGYLLNIEKDSTFKWTFWTEWNSRKSFGTWTMIPNKKNTILLKSSSSDYTHIPIYVRESHQGHTGTVLIFTQGKQFYDCEFNEVLVNGNPIMIDKDTIFLSNGNVDSLSVRLGFSEWMRNNLTAALLYPAIYSQVYYPSDSANNVYEITLPVYPTYSTSSIVGPRASTLFSYVPMETEAIYRNGKWYIIGRSGKTTFSFRRQRKER